MTLTGSWKAGQFKKKRGNEFMTWEEKKKESKRKVGKDWQSKAYYGANAFERSTLGERKEKRTKKKEK